MDVSDCELLWRQIHERNTLAAQSIDQVKFSELASRATVQASEFAELAIPTSGHELNLRRVASCRMKASWTAEMSTPDAAPATVDPSSA